MTATRFENIGETDQAFADEIADLITGDRDRFGKGFGKQDGAVTYVRYVRDDEDTVEICFHGFEEADGTFVVEKILEKHFKTKANHILGTGEPVDFGRFVWFGDNKRDQQRRGNHARD